MQPYLFLVGSSHVIMWLYLLSRFKQWLFYPPIIIAIRVKQLHIFLTLNILGLFGWCQSSICNAFQKPEVKERPNWCVGSKKKIDWSPEIHSIPSSAAIHLWENFVTKHVMFASKKSKDFLKNYLAFLINSLNMVIREKCKELQKDKTHSDERYPFIGF